MEIVDKRTNKNCDQSFCVEKALIEEGWLHQLTGAELKLYICLLKQLQDGYHDRPTYKHLSSVCGINERTVPKAIDKLIEYEFIDKEERTHSEGQTATTKYFIFDVPKKNDIVQKPTRQGEKYVLSTHWQILELFAY